MSDQHSRFAPSDSDGWMRCPAKVPRTEAIVAERGEPEPHPSAQWGTDSHLLLQQGIIWGLTPGSLAKSDEESVAQAKCADEAYIYAMNAQQQMQPCALHTEVPVDPGQLTGFPGLTKGTCDIVLASGVVLEVDDYKTGRHVVEPDSYQLQLYLLGALNAYWPDRSQPIPFQQFRTGVIQPRAPHKQGPIRHKEWTLQDLLNLERDMITQIQAAQDPNRPAMPGEIQCRYCLAKGNCEEHAVWVRKAILGPEGTAEINPISEEIATNISTDAVKRLTPEQLSEALTAIPSFEAWIVTLQDEARHRLEKREDVPGWKLGRAKSRPKWLNDTEATAKKLRNIKGVLKKHYMRDQLKTPLQVMRDVPEETTANVEKLWERPEGALIVVPDTDPRSDPMEWVDSIPKQEN